MYQYSFVNAQNHYMGMIQTETVSVTRDWIRQTYRPCSSHISNLILRRPHPLFLAALTMTPPIGLARHGPFM